MFVFYLITLLYGSNSLHTALTNVLSVNKTMHLDKKKHGIMDLLKSDPKKFISEVQSLDPASIKHIITLLEDLRESSEIRENVFVNALTDAQTALGHSNDNLIAAFDALNAANGEVDTAQGVVDDANVVLGEKQAAAAAALSAHGAAEDDHEAKTTSKNDAQAALDAEKPSLDDEQQILTDVINLMTGLHDKYNVGEYDALRFHFVSNHGASAVCVENLVLYDNGVAHNWGDVSTLTVTDTGEWGGYPASYGFIGGASGYYCSENGSFQGSVGDETVTIEMPEVVKFDSFSLQQEDGMVYNPKEFTVYGKSGTSDWKIIKHVVDFAFSQRREIQHWTIA